MSLFCPTNDKNELKLEVFVITRQFSHQLVSGFVQNALSTVIMNKAMLMMTAYRMYQSSLLLGRWQVCRAGPVCLACHGARDLPSLHAVQSG